MKMLTVLLLILFSGCASEPTARVVAGPEVRITEINPNKWTAITRQNLEHLLQVYHLAPILYTKDIEIQSRVIPHSHPVLTLNTRYAEEPHKLLSVFIHEQLHWLEESKKLHVNKAIMELKSLFPKLPKEGIAKDVHSTYLHLIICYLEYESLIFYLKKKEANEILKDFIYKDKKYVWIYKQVYLKNKEIGKIVAKYDLQPSILRPVVKPKPKTKPVQKPTKKPPLSSAKRLKNL